MTLSLIRPSQFPAHLQITVYPVSIRVDPCSSVFNTLRQGEARGNRFDDLQSFPGLSSCEV
jgi:hypothetical protein